MDWFEDPRHLQPHLACDVFELHVLSGVLSEVSKADMRDIIRDSGLEDDKLQSRAATIVGSGLKGEDAVDALLDIYLVHLRSRSRLMNALYPLQVERNALKLKPGAGHSDSYSFLVFCSRLDAIANRNLRERAAMGFEEIAAQAAEIGLGEAFQVYGLGTSKYGASRLFSSNKATSLKRMARWFRERIDPAFLAAAGGASGDHGVDIIGKLKMDTLAPGNATFLGQCAASSDEKYWKDKKYDTEKVLEVIRFFQQPMKALFIPCYYRNVDGGWANITSLTNVIVFDRLRFVSITNARFVFRHANELTDLKSSFVASAV